MTLRLAGNTSGFTEIDAPAVAGSNTLILPTGNGSAGNILGTDGAGNLSWVDGRMVRATAQSTTSGTAIDFTGIPSWAKQVTVMLDGVSLNGTDNILIQLGDNGGIENTGYLSGCNVMTSPSNVSTVASTAGFILFGSAANAAGGMYSFANLTGNAWVGSGVWTYTNSTIFTAAAAGTKTLSATLDRVRITATGSNTFDGGTANIFYEG